MFKLSVMLGTGFFVTQVFAFPCFLTVAKDSCWTKYNVNINLSNPAVETAKPIVSLSIPAGQTWGRQSFDCQPAESLSFSATFSPVFWQSDVGKTYAAQRDWALPLAIEKGVTAWNISLCFPADFIAVPLPPDATNNCQCSTKDIPPIKPQ